MIRPLIKSDRNTVHDILIKTEMFTNAEIKIAEELIDIYLNRPDQRDYEIIVVENEKKVVGYLCFGPTPLTEGTYDLYWMAVHPLEQGRGFGKQMVRWLEDKIKEVNGRLIIIETSSQIKYEPTRQFYLRQNYRETARISDFYKKGDDRVIYTKYFQ